MKNSFWGVVSACLLLIPINASADLEQLTSGVIGRLQMLQLHADGNVTYFDKGSPNVGSGNPVLARTGYGAIFPGSLGSQPDLWSAAVNYAGDVTYSTTQGGSYTITGELVNTAPRQVKLFDFATGVTTTVAEEGLAGVPTGGSIDVYGITAGKKITFSAGETTTYESLTQIAKSITGIYTVTGNGSSVTELVRVAVNQLLSPSISPAFRPKPNSNGDVVYSLSALSTDNLGNLVTDGSTLKRTAGGSAAVSLFSGIYQPAPDGNGSVVSPFAPEFGRLTNNNQYINHAGVTDTSGGVLDDSGLFSFDGVGITQLVREGDALPGGGVMGNISYGRLSFTPDDSVIFRSNATGTADNRLYKFGNGQLTELARTGQSYPNSAEVIQSLNAIGQVQSVRNDLALFSARSTASTSGFPDVLLLTDGTDTVEVARAGSPGFTDRPLFVSINEYGEVAFGGNGPIYRYSPDLSWKNSASGQWEGAANWTFGLAPGARNTVSIDDANGSIVTGPVSDTTVKAVRVGVSGNTNVLALGSGNLVVGTEVEVGLNSQIDLNGKAITVGVGAPETSADTMRVYAGGTLGGSGTIIGDVVNDGGTVGPGFSPGTLIIDGNYTHGAGSILNIEVGGLGEGLFDQLIILGDATFEAGSTINFDFIDGFSPSLDDNLSFFTAASVLGDLSLLDYSFSGLEDGFLFDTSLNVGTFEFIALSDGVSTSSVSSVPIPGAVWLFGSGLLGLIGISRRKAA